MPNYKNDAARLEETISLIEDCLREGYSPPWQQTGRQAVQEASRRAVEAGMVTTQSAFATRFRSAKERYREPDWTLYRAPVYQRPSHNDNENIVIERTEPQRPDENPITVCCIGDCHDDPRLPDKSRFEWLGRWCAQEKPDYIWQAGDWATFDSVSMHAKPGTLDAQNNPRFKEDIKSLRESMNAFERGLNGYKCKKIFTEGNHEHRVARYENMDPRFQDALVPEWKRVFEDAGWTIWNYGEFFFINSIGFVHHPINAAGRAFGGKTGNQRAGNDATFSILRGHDHRQEFVSVPKIGPNQALDIISVGTTLPFGHVEEYAKLSTTGWYHGVVKITIRGNQITDKAAISMLTIEDRFGANFEEWRRIPGYPEFEVSSKGRVRHDKYFPEVTISPAGYPIFCLPKGSKPKKMFVHVAVCLAWHGEKPDGMQVAHLNGVRDDARPENLKWVTPAENSSHRILHGTQAAGEMHGMAKMNKKKVSEMRKLYTSGAKQRDLSSQFGMDQVTVSAIVNNKLWFDPTYIPKKSKRGPKAKQ